jgi:hypothetical protein
MSMYFARFRAPKRWCGAVSALEPVTVTMTMTMVLAFVTIMVMLQVPIAVATGSAVLLTAMVSRQRKVTSQLIVAPGEPQLR